MAAGAIAADLQELHSGMGQNGRPHPGVAGHVGHLGRDGQRPAVLAGDRRREPHSPHQVFQVARFRVQTERQGLDRERPFPDGLLDARLAGRLLFRPEDVCRRPTRNDPGKAFFRRQLPLLIDDPQRAVHHLHAVLPQNAFDRIGIADIKMRLEGDPHVGDLGRRRDIRLGWSGDGLDLPGRIGRIDLFGFDDDLGPDG